MLSLKQDGVHLPGCRFRAAPAPTLPYPLRLEYCAFGGTASCAGLRLLVSATAWPVLGGIALLSPSCLHPAHCGNGWMLLLLAWRNDVTFLADLPVQVLYLFCVMRAGRFYLGELL